MLLSDFDYELPPEAIAQTPLCDRASSKLLWLNRATGEIRDMAFRQVREVLRPGDLLVVNNTRVSALRLAGHRPTGAKVEVLLLAEEEPGAYIALAKPGRRLRAGSTILFEHGLQATVAESLPDGRKRMAFEPKEGLADSLQRLGTVPLPPYITQPISDPMRYQTVYAARNGSAAAPTAGLHFTQDLLAELVRLGVKLAGVTLDVSLDTFRPVRVEDPEDHVMHGERCSLPPDTADAIRDCKGRIIAVGTTTVRTLESFAAGARRVEPGTMDSRLFIKPGYGFKVVDGMFTNFHLPRTTMLMMVGALSTPANVLRSYAHALAVGYRFLSFGDSMLIL